MNIVKEWLPNGQFFYGTCAVCGCIVHSLNWGYIDSEKVICNDDDCLYKEANHESQ